MADISLLVSRNGNSFNLKINGVDGADSNVLVSPGNTVRWSLAPSSGLDRLIAVATVTKGDNCYKDDPKLATLISSYTPQSDGSIVGTVTSTSPGTGKFERYKICFTVPGDLREHWDDPKLQMNA